MNAPLGHLLLAVAWMLITGSFTPSNFTLGLVCGFLVLWAARDLVGAGGYLRRASAVGRLVATFLAEVAVSNARVAYDLLTPDMYATPAIVAVDLDARSDLEVLLLSMLVALTPGTVVVHVREDRRRMYVYGMYVRDPDAFRARLKTAYEQRILTVTRPGEAR